MNDSVLKQAPLKTVILIYPGVTLLDMIGPATALSMFGSVQLVWKNREPIASDNGFLVTPNATLAEVPEHFDLLLIPGGPGKLAPLDDQEVLDFVRDCGRRADYLTSVCTGALILGAAGLLKGYRATTHWAAHDLLPDFGAIPVNERIVIDRNRLTGGGVTAGIDFGLTLLARLRGDEAAKIAQLIMEYDPAPPFNSGSPETAGLELTAKVRQMVDGDNEEIRRLAKTEK